MAIPPTRIPRSRLQRVLVVSGVLLLAFNLRPAAVSVGPVLAEVRADLGLSAAGAGILTALPVLSFALFGAFASSWARGLGIHRVTLVALLAVVAGISLRSLTDSVPVFFAMTVLALAGMATSNVLLPSLIKLHFPDQIGRFTAMYTTALAIGLTASSVLTVPISEATGSWRWGLGAWAVTALIAAVPWVSLLRHDSTPQAEHGRITLRQVARTPIGRAMALMFGLQSLQAYTAFGWFAQVYRDAGFSATNAGLLLGLLGAISIPVSLWVPTAAVRRPDQTRLMLGLIACYPVGYLGLILAPREGAILWALLVGVGSGVFPLVLTLIGLRTRTSDGTAALSGFTQAIGYSFAAVGPFGAGLLYDISGDWTIPLLALTGVAAVSALLASSVARPVYLEDQLRGTIEE